MNKEEMILKKLAYEYVGIANSEKNNENIKLHKAVNDLKPIRPVVLINELPWHEMNINGELSLLCNDPYLRTVEWFLRSNIYKNKYMPADMVVPPFIPVNKVVHSTGIGITVNEEILHTDKDNNIVAHRYIDILKTEDDLQKLKNPIISYDKQETLRRYNLVGEILGDIIPVKITGSGYFGIATWDDISRYRGVENLLTDLALRPDFMHKIVRRITDIKLSVLEQMETLNLFDNNPYDLHCTPIHTNDLPGSHFDGVNYTRKNIWGRGTAQIFASVSASMHDEFDIEYMKESIGQCGLSYYGCCEPLDKKIDILKKLDNLRKISITPWADVRIAAEAIQNRYVLSAKPNPASVAVPNTDKEYLQKEIKTILDACQKNNCPCDIVLKDISTCRKRPENIFDWEKVVMNMVTHY